MWTLYKCDPLLTWVVRPPVAEAPVCGGGAVGPLVGLQGLVKLEADRVVLTEVGNVRGDLCLLTPVILR